MDRFEAVTIGRVAITPMLGEMPLKNLKHSQRNKYVHLFSSDGILKLSAQPYGQPNAKYVHFCTCTRYLMCT